MRKTEMTLGLIAGIAGLVLAVLSLLGVTEYLPGTLARAAYSGYILLGANALGIVGALIVLKCHVAGSVLMLVATVTVMVLGFPWQSIPGRLHHGDRWRWCRRNDIQKAGRRTRMSWREA